MLSVLRAAVSVQTRAAVKSGLRRASSQASPTSSSRLSGILLGTAFVGGLLGYSGAVLRNDSLKAPTMGSPQPAAATTKPSYASPEEFDVAIEELKVALPDKGAVSTDLDDLRAHGLNDGDYHEGGLHTVVVYPDSTEDVVKVVKIANKYRIPITPYGSGTSLEGHVAGMVQGICLDMCNMNRILEIHEADSDLVCQPAVGWMEVNETLRQKGLPLFFPLDPAPSASIGGMLSTGCSGTNAVRYGTAKAEWFLNATVVLPSGEVIKTRRRSRKSSAGFDTTKLFIGAEGTLGVVTEVTIRLAPLLPTTVAVVQFPNVRKATEAVIDVLNQSVGIQCVELLDSVFMKATNLYGQSARKWPEKDSLFFKIQGTTPSSIAETAKVIQTITGKHGGEGFTLAKDDKEAEDLWTDRKNGHYAGLALVPGSRGWPTDVCVPISKLPELVYETKADIAAAGLTSCIVGHVGDGNFHAQINIRTPEEQERAREIVHRMVERAIQLDGTCTGEHGVGIGKKEFLVEELGEGTVELMKTIKRAVDPLGIMNPGKLYPDDPPTK